ncbi:MAG: nitrite reductase [Eubacteriales bacterium]
MSIEIEDKEKMIKTCQAILDSCEKPFIWEEEDTFQYGNYNKPFNLFMPHKQIESELLNLFETFSGSKYLHDQIKVICTLDKEWVEAGTYAMDRHISLYFKQFKMKPEYIEQVKTYFTNRLIELQKSKNEIGA